MIINGYEIEPGADLTSANLRGANLTEADLTEAELTGADLTGANLRGANLRDASLRDASLRDANLTSADLVRANLTGAILPDGRTLAEYREWLPQGLLTRGGKPLEEVVASWGCHDWEACPMATAFDVHELANVPECWRSGAALFIALFDGGHLPQPDITT